MKSIETGSFWKLVQRDYVISSVSHSFKHRIIYIVLLYVARTIPSMTSSLFCRVGNLNIIDQTIRNGVDNKNKLLCEMVELFGKDDATTAKVGSTYTSS